jgi:hypothetical protein
MNHRKSGEKEDLNTLMKDLEQSLQLQVDIIMKKIKDIRSNQDTKSLTIINKKKTLKVSDTVIVTGTYCNCKGVTGTIVQITPVQIQLRLDNRKDEFQIYKQNVKLL